MSNYEFLLNLKDVNNIIRTINLISIVLVSFYIFVKTINEKSIKKGYLFFLIIFSAIISSLAMVIEKRVDSYYSWLFIAISVILEKFIVFKKELNYTILITIISISISYVIYMISVMVCFIPTAILKIENDVINALNILIYILLVHRVFKIRKLKYGISFLQKKLESKNINIIILNIAAITLFSFFIIQNSSDIGVRQTAIACILLAITMIITIKQSFDLYYQQMLLTKELEAKKNELEVKKNEIEKLERENLTFSKTSHSLAHKQKLLEFKLNQLMRVNTNTEYKYRIKEEIDNLSKEVYKEPKEVNFDKTEVDSIDNVLLYMQSECKKNNIKFELQIVGNIFYMINNLISENDLEMLIADHIKDAIIAINSSNNINRSILVRIGKIDNTYSLYIYDSGIEFSKEVLDNLGKKPITTHADTGGTGMGFMNTFDTINKTKASLIINEIGKPCEDNYTKVLIFKFDNKNEFKVNSYKDEVLV